MITMNLAIEVAAITAKDVYVPVPCRGIVSAAYAVYSEETDLDETINIQRATTSVNLITPPADATAEGVTITGVPDTTYKSLIFDPDSATVANKVMKISMPDTFDTAGMIGLKILYDNSCYIKQDPSEA